MKQILDDAERLMIAAWAIVSRAVVPEAGPDRDYLKELVEALKPGKAQAGLASARGILQRWKNHASSETDREYLDELLALLSGPTTIAAQDDVFEQLQQPSHRPRANGDTHTAEAEAEAPSAPRIEEVVASPVLGRTVSEVERDLIIDTLDKVGGNRTRAAKLVGISPRTLRNKLHQYAGEGLAIPKRGNQRSPR